MSGGGAAPAVTGPKEVVGTGGPGPGRIAGGREGSRDGGGGRGGG